MGLEDGIAQQTVLFEIVAEVNKTLIHNELYAFLVAPGGEPQHILFLNEVARRVVGIHNDEVADFFVFEEAHQVVGCIAVIAVLRDKGHLLVRLKAVGIFFEGGSHHTRFPLHVFHQQLDELGGSVSGNDVRLAHAEAFAGDEGVHLHARGIFGQQGAEVGLHLVYQPLGWEIGIHQIAEVEHLGEAPESAIAPVVFPQEVVLAGEEGLCDVQVLLVVNLIPPLVSDGQGFQVVLVQQRDDAQYVLVVFVVAYGFGVSGEEGHILALRELLAELVDVHGLVIILGVVVVEGVFPHEVHDVLLFVQANHRAVHPRFVFRHKGKVFALVADNHLKQMVAEDEVALNEQRVISLQLLFCQR